MNRQHGMKTDVSAGMARAGVVEPELHGGSAGMARLRGAAPGLQGTAAGEVPA